MIWVRKIGCGDVKWIKLSQDKKNAELNLQDP